MELRVQVWIELRQKSYDKVRPPSSKLPALLFLLFSSSSNPNQTLLANRLRPSKPNKRPHPPPWVGEPSAGSTSLTLFPWRSFIHPDLSVFRSLLPELQNICALHLKIAGFKRVPAGLDAAFLYFCNQCHIIVTINAIPGGPLVPLLQAFSAGKKCR